MRRAAAVLGKILNGIVLMILILVLAFCVAKVGGIDAYVVRSGSMEPAIKTGSLCFVNTHSPYDDIKAGDVIAFRIATGDLVTHRAITVTDQGIETKGDNNDTSDGISTDRTNYIGKTIFSIPEVGRALVLISQPKGIILILTAIFAVRIVGSLLLTAKKEQEEEEKV